jgi:hypothetical protein
MKKCCFCGEGLSDTTAVCPWCGRRQQQHPSQVELEESPIKVKVDLSDVPPIKIEADSSGFADALKRIEDFLADIHEETGMVHNELTKEELIEWDARDEKAREAFRHSQRELCRKTAETKHLPAVIESEDGTILSVCKFDKTGKWQFIDFDGFARIPGDNKQQKR